MLHYSSESLPLIPGLGIPCSCGVKKQREYEVWYIMHGSHFRKMTFIVAESKLQDATRLQTFCWWTVSRSHRIRLFDAAYISWARPSSGGTYSRGRGRGRRCIQWSLAHFWANLDVFAAASVAVTSPRYKRALRVACIVSPLSQNKVGFLSRDWNSFLVRKPTGRLLCAGALLSLAVW